MSSGGSSSQSAEAAAPAPPSGGAAKHLSSPGNSGSFGYDGIQAWVDNPKPQLDDPSVKMSLGEGLGGSIGDR